MPEEMTGQALQEMKCEEELHDVLIAISVISRRLATKIAKQNKTKEGEVQHE